MLHSPPRYTHILWDWNGTIVNDAEDSLKVVNQLLESRSLSPVTLDFYRSVYQHPVSEMYKQFGFDIEGEKWPRLCDEWFKSYLAAVPHLKLHSDSKRTIQYFKDHGCIQAVLSALPHDLLIDSIARHDLAEYFHAVSGLNDRLGISKVGNGAWVMERIHATSSTTLMIGDSSHDFEVAQALGVDCALVARGLESESRLRRNPCPVFDDFSGLLKFAIKNS